MFIPDKTRPLIQKIADGEAFGSNHIDSQTANITYIGKEDRDGNWIVQKMDETTANLNVITYATKKNNPSEGNYSSAWGNRASLTYGLFSEIL